MVILLKEWSLFIGLLKIGEFINESHGFKMTVTESLYHEKAIYLSGGPLGRYVSRRTLCERRLVLMVTYSDLFSFVIMLCAVITPCYSFYTKNSTLALVK